MLRRGCGNRTSIRALKDAPRLAALFCCCSAAVALSRTSALDIRVFTSGTNNVVAAPSGMLVYSSASRSIRPLVLDNTAIRDTIVDVVESEEQLWVVTQRDLFRVDMATLTVERIGFPGSSAETGRIAADYDYVWIACSDTLWQYDRLGREYLAYAVPAEHGGQATLGATSNEEQVFVATPRGCLAFSVMNETWKLHRYAGESLSPRTRYVVEAEGLVLVDGKRIVRFSMEDETFETLTVPGMVSDAVVDASMTDGTTMFVLAEGHLSAYDAQTSILRPIDVRRMAQAASLAKVSDSLLAVVSGSQVAFYDVENQSTEYVQYRGVNVSGAPQSATRTGSGLFILFDDQVATYDTDNRVWESAPRGGAGAGKRRLTWDDKGLTLTYARGYTTQLRGLVEQTLSLKDSFALDSVVACRSVRAPADTVVGTRRYSAGEMMPDCDTVPDSLPAVAYDIPSSWLRDEYIRTRIPIPYRTDVTLHTALAGGRYLDLYLDNTDKERLARKGALYRGSASDIVQTVSLGRNSTALPPSKTLPQTTMEGFSGTVETPRKLATRDRKIGRLDVGGGYVTGRTVHKVLGYEPGGSYRLIPRKDASAEKTDTTRLVPGSLTLTIDGEEIDSTMFTFYPTTGRLLFQRRDIADPHSVIIASYELETVPDSGLEWIDMVPGNSFASMGHINAQVSPTDWLSARAGYVPIRSGSDWRHLVHGGLPVELRRDKLLLKLDPELSYDATNRAKASGLGLRSRFGTKTSLLLDGFLADTNFVSTDNISRGYGLLHREVDFSITHDLRREIELRYVQRNTRAAKGTEDRFELSAKVHFPRYPFLDVGVSRNLADGVELIRTAQALSDTADTVDLDSLPLSPPDSTIDTLNLSKDKISLRLYETSSAFLVKALPLHRAGYEIALTEYRAEDRTDDIRGRGRTLYLKGLVAPLNSLTMTGGGTYRLNPAGAELAEQMDPYVQLQTVGLPPGVDLDGRYYLDFSRPAVSDTSSLTLTRSAGARVKPGVWTQALGWMSPRASLSQSVQCGFHTGEPSFTTMALGRQNREDNQLTRSLGIHLFPKTDILFRNRNDWIDTEELRTFVTFNDFTFWFNDREALWQTRWEHTADNAGAVNSFGYTRLDNQWTSVLHTKAGVSASYTVEVDTVAAGTELRTATGGPLATVGINAHDILVFRKLLNTHAIKLDWRRENGRLVSGVPDMSYTVLLRLDIVPNFSLVANNTLTVASDGNGDTYDLETYSGVFSVRAMF